MSQPERPNVVQGRLGWEDGDISEAKPGELKPHPKNREIYGDTESADDIDGSFKESVAENGVLEPLVITNGKEIVSGHRRWLAAKAAGVETVPVRYAEFDSDLAEREALVEFNRQREKTPGQVVNEFEEMLEIERERQGQGERNDLKDTSGNVSGSYESESREKAAERVDADVSGRTLEKGLQVKEKAEEGDETAKEAWDGLKSGEESFNSAHERVTSANDDDSKEADSSSDIEPFTSQQTDEWSSPRELVEPLAGAIDGFDLDPCSGAEQSPFAAETYTEDDDGLAQEWAGDVWVNPPYSGVSEWVDKATAEIQQDRVNRILFLCKGDSSTEWWNAAAQEATCVLAVDRRLSFGDGENSAPFASHVVVFGDATGLCDALREQGTVLTPGCPNRSGRP